jgi:hypothetical protein
VELGKHLYQGQYIQRTGSRADGCATFFHTERLKYPTRYNLASLSNHVFVNYNDHTEDDSIKTDNVALFEVFQPIGSLKGHPFLIVGNSHFYFKNPAARMQQCQVLLETALRLHVCI